jgi:hypothetical protein
MQRIPTPFTFIVLLLFTCVLVSCKSKKEESLSLVEELSQNNMDLKRWDRVESKSLKMRAPLAFLNQNKEGRLRTNAKRVFSADDIEMIINSEYREEDTLIAYDYLLDEIFTYSDFEVVSDEKVFHVDNRRATLRTVKSEEYGVDYTVFLFTLEDYERNYYISWEGDSKVMQYLYDDFKKMIFSAKLD